jgi:multisubunit Na+/H+ antiporter MnhB subunit
MVYRINIPMIYLFLIRAFLFHLAEYLYGIVTRMLTSGSFKWITSCREGTHLVHEDWISLRGAVFCLSIRKVFNWLSKFILS